MAEENKTTTKKTTTKKVEAEEVKVEKKFCTRCGKELSNGEACTCEARPAQSVNINTDQLLSIGSNFLNTIINSFKKPSTTLKEEVRKSNLKSSLITLAVIAITYGLYMMGAFGSLITTFGNLGGFNVNDVVELPYFKIFLYMTIINYVVAFIPILAALGVAKLTGNKNFSFAKSTTLYVTSLMPTIFTNLLMAILYALNILPSIGALVGMVVSVVCFFNFILGFINETTISEDRKPYSLAALIIIWIVGYVVVLVLFAGGIASDLTKDVNMKNPNDIYDSFNW